MNRKWPDREPWIGFFLRCLKRQKDSLATRLDRERAAEARDTILPALSLRVIRALSANERLTIAELAAMTRANRNTLKLYLRGLVKAGRVRQPGKPRATWYSL